MDAPQLQQHNQLVNGEELTLDLQPNLILKNIYKRNARIAYFTHPSPLAQAEYKRSPGLFGNRRQRIYHPLVFCGSRCE